MRHRKNTPVLPILPLSRESRFPPQSLLSFQPDRSNLDYHNSLNALEEDWTNQVLGTPTSSASSFLFDICCCCGRHDCESLDIYNRTMKKLESDTRLAAELGQGLLNTHETFVSEVNQQRGELDKQLFECQQKNSALKQSLEESENARDELIKEKNKWTWEQEKKQKILDDTLSDLDMATDKCNQLTLELDTKNKELEKLRIFKFMARHSENQEEALRAKLEDANQELLVSRRNELGLESKMKKLKMKYESLCDSHEKLSRDIEEKLNETINNSNKQSDTFKTVMVNPESSHQDLIHLIKEIATANTKLKLDLMNTREQLTEARAEITSFNEKIEEEENIDHKKSRLKKTAPGISLQKEISKSTALIDKKKPLIKPKRAVSVKGKNKAEESPKTKPILPALTVSASMPTSSSENPESTVVHHHYHYYVKNEKGEKVELDECVDISAHPVVMTPSTSTPTIKDPESASVDTVLASTSQPIRSPYLMLLENVSQIVERLRGSDIRALNRRLKRAFDITELSSMSNSVIENILLDIDTLDSRFLWIKEKQESSVSKSPSLLMMLTHPTADDMGSFFPFLELLKDILKELGLLRTTMNELQVEYVKKVEEDEARVEEDIIRKRQLKKRQAAEKATPHKPLSWLSSMFYRSSSNTDAMDTPHSDMHLCYDKGSTITKTTTNSSTLLLSPDEEESLILRKEDELYHITTGHTVSSRIIPPRSLEKQRRGMTHYPNMVTSLSAGTSSHRGSPTPLRPKRSLHRVNIDYDGIGVRPIPSKRDPEWKVGSFSSSWLGGK